MLLPILRDVCLPILLVTGVGWLADRRLGLNLQTLVRLNLYVFVPVFIFVRLTTSDLSDRVGAQVIGFTLLVIGAMALASWAVARSRRERLSLQLATMFYNSGNWGIPLMTLAFSDLGPVVQVFVLATMNVTTFTIGLFLASSHDGEDGSRPPAWRRLLPVLRQPSLYGIAAALICRRLGNPLEDVVFIWKPLLYLADALVAFALVTLGAQLSQTRPPRIEGALARALLIRLLGGPLTAAGLTLLFGFHGEFAAILILSAASPTAVNTALLAHEFKGDTRFASAAVFYSTLLAAGVVTGLLGAMRGGWLPWAQP
ncbi:MAG: AEC family transporter [Verrucomicrobiae bacterium]|nr:AEC family transporter [Verrucomicrobiae bacterium]MCP5539701.1 AEC family transporter [Akkermansiaceae bacterium]